MMSWHVSTLPRNDLWLYSSTDQWKTMMLVPVFQVIISIVSVSCSNKSRPCYEILYIWSFRCYVLPIFRVIVLGFYCFLSNTASEVWELVFFFIIYVCSKAIRLFLSLCNQKWNWSKGSMVKFCWCWWPGSQWLQWDLSLTAIFLLFLFS